MHQVTAATLHSLMKDAFMDYEFDCEGEGIEPKPDLEWLEECSKRPLFKFWLTVLNLEVAILAFVCSVRTANFVQYKESIKLLIPWFLLLDHQMYGRWLPVHLKDLEELQSKAPEVYAAFMEGKRALLEHLHPVFVILYKTFPLQESLLSISMASQCLALALIKLTNRPLM